MALGVTLAAGTILPAIHSDLFGLLSASEPVFSSAAPNITVSVEPTGDIRVPSQADGSGRSLTSVPAPGADGGVADQPAEPEQQSSRQVRPHAAEPVPTTLAKSTPLDEPAPIIRAELGPEAAQPVDLAAATFAGHTATVISTGRPRMPTTSTGSLAETPVLRESLLATLSHSMKDSPMLVESLVAALADSLITNVEAIGAAIGGAIDAAGANLLNNVSHADRSN